MSILTVFLAALGTLVLITGAIIGMLGAALYHDAPFNQPHDPVNYR